MAIYSDIEQTNTKVQTINEDIASIYQSITNILNTTVTERFFNPEFGSLLEDLLFEPIDIVTEAKIYRFVIDAIERWEPRVKLDHGKSNVIGDEDNYKYDIELVFSIVGLDLDNLIFQGTLLQEQ